MSNYVYLKTPHSGEHDEPLYTVGFYDQNGHWVPTADYTDVNDAEREVHYLNGGPDAHVHCAHKIHKLEDEKSMLYRTLRGLIVAFDHDQSLTETQISMLKGAKRVLGPG